MHVDDRPTSAPGSRSRRRVRAVEVLAWIITSVLALVALSQVMGVTWTSVMYVLQALTPYVMGCAIPLAVAACLLRRHVLALVNASIGVVLLVLCVPVVFHVPAAAVAVDAPRVTVAHANAYFENRTPDRAATALLAIDADVLAVTEYDGDIAAALDRQGVTTRYPFHLERAPSSRNGVALFSRFPMTASSLGAIGGQDGIEATIEVPVDAVGEAAPALLRVIVVHPLPGIDRAALRQWRRDLPQFGERALAPGPPTVMVGDFNASRWHPAFRRLLAMGLIDAHEQVGAGFSRSWPNGGWLPRFVRLDHALLSDGLTATAVHDVAVPGSDHLGFVVDLALTTP